jgi:hypothetical protein
MRRDRQSAEIISFKTARAAKKLKDDNARRAERDQKFRDELNEAIGNIRGALPNQPRKPPAA